MATFLFRCGTCGTRFNAATPDLSGETLLPCIVCMSFDLKRDWRGEAVGVNVGNLKREREGGGKEAQKRLFLPSNDDFKGPGDPDGTKGMREWRDTHQPRPSNTKPDWPGHVEKKVY